MCVWIYLWAFYFVPLIYIFVFVPVPLEKAMAPHSSTFAWKIPWMEEPGRLQSMGLLRVGHDWTTSLSLFTFMHWRRKWQPTPVFLPGESQEQSSPLGCHLWGCKELDTTEQLNWTELNFMAAVTICSDFGAPQNKVSHCFCCFHNGYSIGNEQKQNTEGEKEKEVLKRGLMSLGTTSRSLGDGWWGNKNVYLNT